MKTAAWSRLLWGAWTLLALLVMAGPAAAQGSVQVGEIAGTVHDLVTHKPLSPAVVTIQGTTWGASTQEDGTYVIRNVPVGTYDLKVALVGYTDKSLTGIVVKNGETTRAAFELLERVVAKIDAITVWGKRPKIDKGRTGTSYTTSAEDLSNLPVDDLTEAISLKAGVIAKGGELHFRGGRGSEVQYQVDGVPVRDPLVGGGLDLAMLAVQEQEVLMGGLDAKYGNAQSGVVIFKTKEGGERFSGEIRYTTDDYGSPKNTFDNYDRLFVGAGGPVPISNMTYYLSGEVTYADDYPKTGERRSRRRLLDFVSIGDRKSNSLKMQGKIAYRPTPNHKLTFEAINQESRRDNYYHMWNQSGYVETFLDTTQTEEVVLLHGRWSPTPLDSTYVYYNAAEHTPNVTDTFDEYKLVLLHQLSQNSQYSLRLSSQAFHTETRVQDKKEWEYLGDRDRDYWFNYHDFESYDFNVISGDYPFLSTRDTRVYQGLCDLTWKYKKHTFEAGVSGAYNDMRYFSISRPYLSSAGGEIGFPRTFYHYYNPEGAAYVQDRWEHEGMVLNLGMRYDVFSVGDQVPLSEVADPVKQQLSPRVGIGYPISDRDLFSFYYARLYQIPNRQYIFDNRDVYDGVRGNPNLTNETTIQYQAAIQHLFSELLVGQFSIYYKDIYGLISAQQVDDWSSTGTITTYVNRDYASAKGFEVSLSRGYRNYMRWDISYTYGVALGVSSDPNAAASRDFVYLPTSEQPLDWDVRHSVGVAMSLGDRRTWGVHMTWDYMTGSPYTPVQRDTRQTEPETINSRRMPSETTLNMRADKYYTVWGKQLSLFLDARNVLDAKNIGNLEPGNFPGPPVNTAYVVYYTETGRAGGAYLKDVNRDGVDDFVPLNDPRVFGEPRTIRMGIGLEF